MTKDELLAAIKDEADIVENLTFRVRRSDERRAALIERLDAVRALVASGGTTVKEMPDDEVRAALERGIYGPHVPKSAPVSEPRRVQCRKCGAIRGFGTNACLCGERSWFAADAPVSPPRSVEERLGGVAGELSANHRFGTSLSPGAADRLADEVLEIRTAYRQERAASEARERDLEKRKDENWAEVGRLRGVIYLQSKRIAHDEKERDELRARIEEALADLKEQGRRTQRECSDHADTMKRLHEALEDLRIVRDSL